jgi:serine/threonine-protein kinase
MNFGGRYELESRIAVGGMGEVWNAVDTVIGRPVAIKILKDEYLGDPGFLERFRAEARHAALVNHEGIANVYDYGEENGSAFLVMELVPGEPLSSVLEREHSLSIDKVLDVVAQTAAALQAAHAAGLVHRDIKPGNMLITPEGRVKITDFGIARIADQVPLTATGQVMGTVQYLSPEQASGQPASPSTDIYSLGIVAYECLAGKRPFTGESQVAIAMAQINDAPPPLPETIAEPVRNLVMSSIAKKPQDRPTSAAHLARAAQALRRGDLQGAAASVPAVLGTSSVDDATMIMPRTAATGATTVLNIPSSPETGSIPKKRNPWTWPLIALIGVLFIVLVGSIIALLAGGGSTPAPTNSTHTTTPTQTSTPTPTSTGAAINLNDYKGKPAADVVASLKALGFTNVTSVAKDMAPTPAQVGMVYDVKPNGVAVVPFATPVVVTYYDGIPILPAPGAPTVTPSTITGSGVVQVDWSNQNFSSFCPSTPTTALSGFTVTYKNGVTTNVGASETSMQISVSSGPSFNVYLTVVCGALKSPQSAPVIVTVN